MTQFVDKREILLKALKENDTIEVPDMGVNFGRHNEYYCLYLQKFLYNSWSFGKTIEFRPFRNIRIYQKYNNSTYRKIAYFNDWLLNPEYTYQNYENGQPCLGEKWLNKKSTAMVKYICGLDNRIVSFKEVDKCIKYELVFETPFNCELTMTDKAKNLLAIATSGGINNNDLWLFLTLILIFVLGLGLCFLKSRKHT